MSQLKTAQTLLKYWNLKIDPMYSQLIKCMLKVCTLIALKKTNWKLIQRYY